jgi:hypothetical protein
LTINDDRAGVIIVRWILWACALYALAFPANAASAAQTAIPVSDDFVIIVPSISLQRRKGGALR